MTSLRALLIGGLAATALVLPAGTALAGDDGIDRSGPPEAGAPCSPEVDTEYGYDAEGNELACLDGLWTPLFEEAPPDEEALEEDASPSESGDPLTGEDSSAEDAEPDAPLPGDPCEPLGEVYPVEDPALEHTELVCAEEDGGALVWTVPGTGEEEGGLPEEGAPEPAPEEEAPDTECSEETEGTEEDGFTCVCIGDEYHWYFGGDWYFIGGVWYWFSDGFYWCFVDGAWEKDDGGVAEEIAAGAAGSPSPDASPDRALPASSRSSDSSGGLPLTGAPLAALVASAVTAIAVGGGAWLLFRKRRGEADPE